MGETSSLHVPLSFLFLLPQFIACWVSVSFFVLTQSVYYWRFHFSVLWLQPVLHIEVYYISCMLQPLPLSPRHFLMTEWLWSKIKMFYNPVSHLSKLMLVSCKSRSINSSESCKNRTLSLNLLNKVRNATLSWKQYVL